MKTTLETIVVEARELFRDHGYAGMSMQDLANRVGLKKPSLYTRFPSKESLVPEVLDLTVAETFAGVPGAGTDWLAGYRTVLERIAGTLTDRKRCVGGHLALGISAETPIAREAVRDFFVALRDGIAATLRPALGVELAQATATDVLARLQGATVWLAATEDASAMTRAVSACLAEAEALGSMPSKRS